MLERVKHEILHTVLPVPRGSGFLMRNVEAEPEEWERRTWWAEHRVRQQRAREQVRAYFVRSLPRCVVRAALRGDRRALRHVVRILGRTVR